MIELAQKSILVTGASRGIGAAIAVACHRAGARVIPHAVAASPASEKLAKEIETEFLYEDLSAQGAGKRLFATALESAGTVDAVVNNAGVYLPSPLEVSSEDSWYDGWERTLAVNLQAPADICRQAIAHFRSSGGGSIVNIASRAGHRGDGRDHAAYAASKAAMIAMTKTWARAVASEGIWMYVIAPGWVETRMAPEDIEKRAQAVAEIPLGRVAQPDEVAAMATFLLSGRCPSAVGATVDINGASYVR